jgi:hypothetical protein
LVLQLSIEKQISWQVIIYGVYLQDVDLHQSCDLHSFALEVPSSWLFSLQVHLLLIPKPPFKALSMRGPLVKIAFKSGFYWQLRIS